MECLEEEEFLEAIRFRMLRRREETEIRVKDLLDRIIRITLRPAWTWEEEVEEAAAEEEEVLRGKATISETELSFRIRNRNPENDVRAEPEAAEEDRHLETGPGYDEGFDDDDGGDIDPWVGVAEA